MGAGFCTGTAWVGVPEYSSKITKIETKAKTAIIRKKTMIATEEVDQEDRQWAARAVKDHEKQRNLVFFQVLAEENKGTEPGCEPQDDHCENRQDQVAVVDPCLGIVSVANLYVGKRDFPRILLEKQLQGQKRPGVLVFVVTLVNDLNVSRFSGSQGYRAAEIMV